MPVYDFKTHSRTEQTLHVEPQPVILVEGILIFAETAMRPLFDVKIFVDTDADIRFIRRLQRDIESAAGRRNPSYNNTLPQYVPCILNLSSPPSVMLM
jgi:uridine kinase